MFIEVKIMGVLNEKSVNNNLVNEFTCKYDCIRDLKMSDKTLTKSLQNNVSYNGFFYKFLDSKLII
jgi:hypothetical protein